MPNLCGQQTWEHCIFDSQNFATLRATESGQPIHMASEKPLHKRLIPMLGCWRSVPASSTACRLLQPRSRTCAAWHTTLVSMQVLLWWTSIHNHHHRQQQQPHQVGELLTVRQRPHAAVISHIVGVVEQVALRQRLHVWVHKRRPVGVACGAQRLHALQAAGVIVLGAQRLVVGMVGGFVCGRGREAGRETMARNLCVSKSCAAGSKLGCLHPSTNWGLILPAACSTASPACSRHIAGKLFLSLVCHLAPQHHTVAPQPPMNEKPSHRSGLAHPIVLQPQRLPQACHLAPQVCTVTNQKPKRKAKNQSTASPPGAPATAPS